MADKASIAIRLERATTRLLDAMARIADTMGIAAPDMPTRANNPELLRAMQFEAFAGWVEQLADHTEADEDTQPLHGGYTPMTKAELVLELHARGIDLAALKGTGSGGFVVVADLIAALEADDRDHAHG